MSDNQSLSNSNNQNENNDRKQNKDAQVYENKTEKKNDELKKEIQTQNKELNEKNNCTQIESESKDVIKLNDYIKSLGEQQILENELKTELDNKEGIMNRCTYLDQPKQLSIYQLSSSMLDDSNLHPQNNIIDQQISTPQNKCYQNEQKQGYLYQLTFSCRTCYEELISQKLSQIAVQINSQKFKNSTGNSNDQNNIQNHQLVPNIHQLQNLEEIAIEFQKMDSKKQKEFLEEIPNIEIKEKYGIKAHGFCLGCMLQCHDNHEVNELYSKMDLRCDCGNSRLPESCQLMNDKDYENSFNKYSDNYYDIYCHCKQPHDQEAIDEQKLYMLQCFECEDWFHNVHLEPVLKSSNVDEKYFLICKTCIQANGQNYQRAVYNYKEFFYSEIKEFLSKNECEDQEVIHESPLKRQKLQNDQQHKEVNNVLNPEQNLIIDIIISDDFIQSKNFQDELQELKKFQMNNENDSQNHAFQLRKILKLIGSMNNLDKEQTKIIKKLDGEIDFNNQIQNSQNDQDQNENHGMRLGGINEAQREGDEAFEKYFDLMFSKTFQNMLLKKQQNELQQQANLQQLRTGIVSNNQPNSSAQNISLASQVYIAENLAVFKQKFISLLKEASQSGQIITKERIQTFFLELQQEKSINQSKFYK